MKQNHEYDLVILGGGTVGIACFLDATLRGLKTAVIERRHIGKQTNAASLGLLQGGFKYLSTNTNLITSDSIDCGLLRKLVPHLIRMQPVLIPIYNNSGFPPWLWERLFRAYDRYAYARGVEKHKRLSSAEIKEEEPTIKSGAKGGMLFYEWAADPVKLTQVLVNAATKLGGTVYENCEVVDSYRLSTGAGERVERVLVQDNKGKTFWIWGSYFINTAGPWAPHLLKIFGLMPLEARPTRGTSIIINQRLTKNAVIAFDRNRKYIMLLPQSNNQTLIGPTNLDVGEDVRANPDLLRIEGAEIEELLEIGSEITGRKLTLADIVGKKCGLRPQPNHLGVKPDRITHDFIADDHLKRDGIINLGYLYGGKLSNQIRMAKEGVDLACHRMQGLGEWPDVKNWSVPRFSIKPNGNFQILSCAQNCQTEKLYDKRYGLTLADQVGRVALEERLTALLKLAPFVLGIRR